MAAFRATGGIISIGVDNTGGALSLGTSFATAVNIGTSGTTTVNNALTATGLTTANGGLTIGGANNITLGSGATTPTAGQLGYIERVTGSSTLTSNQPVNVATTSSLAKGIWLLTGTVTFPATIAGNICYIWLNTTSQNYSGGNGNIEISSYGAGFVFTTTYVYDVAGPFYLSCAINGSGVSGTALGILVATRIA